MPRRKTGPRVVGVYPRGRRWRVVYICEDGAREEVTFATQSRAKKYAARLERELSTPNIDQAIVQYRQHLQAKGNKASSIRKTESRLTYMLRDADLCTLDVPCLQGLYDDRCRTVAADSHRRELVEAKAFLRFCGARGWLNAMTADELKRVQPVGKMKRGPESKAQLRVDEARRWLTVALQMVESSKVTEREGALASIVCVLLGMRPGEVRGLQVRDVDDGGRLLWAAAEGGKTANARRPLEVPEVLQPLLLRQAKRASRAPALWRNDSEQWVRRWTKKICRRAGVPIVNPQGNRGFHSSVAREAGATGHLVAQQLGHGSESVHMQHYADRGAVSRGNNRRVLRVLEGGK